MEKRVLNRLEKSGFKFVSFEFGSLTVVSDKGVKIKMNINNKWQASYIGTHQDEDFGRYGWCGDRYETIADLIRIHGVQ